MEEDKNNSTDKPWGAASRKKDKIFGNAANTGDYDFKELPDIKPEGEYADRYLGHIYDAENDAMMLKLGNMCRETFQRSQWADFPPDKKFPKDLMPYIFNELFTALDVDGHSPKDIFIAIAEFMRVSYEKVYAAAGHNVKTRLINECDSEYDSLRRRKIKRYF